MRWLRDIPGHVRGRRKYYTMCLVVTVGRLQLNLEHVAWHN